MRTVGGLFPLLVAISSAMAGCGDDDPGGGPSGDLDANREAYSDLADAIDCRNQTDPIMCANTDVARCIAMSCRSEIVAICPEQDGFCPIAALDCASGCATLECQSDCIDDVDGAEAAAYNALVACALGQSCLSVDVRVN